MIIKLKLYQKLCIGINLRRSSSYTKRKTCTLQPFVATLFNASHGKKIYRSFYLVVNHRFLVVVGIINLRWYKTSKFGSLLEILGCQTQENMAFGWQLKWVEFIYFPTMRCNEQVATSYCSKQVFTWWDSLGNRTSRLGSILSPSP